MALKFLFNHAGVAADSIAVPNGTTAAGYDTTVIMTGPRCTEWRSESSGSAAIGYVYDEDVEVTHVVIARADWLLTKATNTVTCRQRSSGGAWSNISGTSYAPLAAANLIGPRSQDLVVACTPTQLRGVGVLSAPPSGSEAVQISKLFGSIAFSFANADPSFGVSTATLDLGARRSPLRATMQYEVEKEFSLRFDGITQAELDEFKASVNLFYWPFFIYDADQTLWEWKLEHVLLGGFQAVPIVEGMWAIEINLFRLRHWD